MASFRCEQCCKGFDAKPSARASAHVFCSPECYQDWRRATGAYRDHNEYHREHLAYRRAVWGSSGRGHKEVGAWARPFGRRFEELARDVSSCPPRASRR